MIYPLLWMLSSSFKPENIIFNDLSLWPSQFTFDNYPNGWQALRIDFSIFYKNSVIVAVFSVIGNLIACAFTAYAFARLEFNFKRFWFALMMMTLMLMMVRMKISTRTRMTVRKRMRMMTTTMMMQL